MSRSHLACVLGLATLAGLAFASGPPQQKTVKSTAPTYRISGPYTHDNLTIFFLRGEDTIKGKKFLTLDEALRDKKVIVHETKQVAKLEIENVSSEDVFVQAGDIVKGGQQDRTLAVDLIVPAKSGKIPVASFCVEQGRWNQRDKENTTYFESSKDALLGNRLKLAARTARNQGQVWRNVGYAQSMLTKSLKADVKDSKSESSLQLTLENKKLLETIDTYVKKLQGHLAKHKDVIGYAVAINGKVNNADVYANADLFKKLWPKLIKCSAIESVLEKNDKQKFALVRVSDVKSFLADPHNGKISEKEVNKKLLELQQETEKNVLIETRTGKDILRRSYLAK